MGESWDPIEVRRTGETPGGMVFSVTLREGRGETRHDVTLSTADLARLAPQGTPPETVVAVAFRFLLDREPKEAILARFDLPLIGRYFPDFETALPGYVARAIAAQR